MCLFYMYRIFGILISTLPYLIIWVIWSEFIPDTITDSLILSSDLDGLSVSILLTGRKNNKLYTNMEETTF